jgi:hypothetical protein
MTAKKPPQEPINTITIDCDVEILGITRTVLKISPHFEKHNEEFRSSKKKKIRENLEQYLLDKKVIKDFVQQLHKKEPEFEGTHTNWEAWKYYVYKPVIDKRSDTDYLITFFLDDNNPELIGVITVYP